MDLGLTETRLISGKAFFDTNIIVYAYSGKDLNKSAMARKLIESNEGFISTQILNELANVLYKKFKLTWLEIEEVLKETISNFEVILLNNETSLNACHLCIRYGYSFYDSLIISSALSKNCTLLYSEDLYNKHVVEHNLRIVNPFDNT